MPFGNMTTSNESNGSHCDWLEMDSMNLNEMIHSWMR
jgi:hypothetical protein